MQKYILFSRKSGRDKTALDAVFHELDWPHFYVSTTAHRPATYDGLSVEEFVYGYLCVVEHETMCGNLYMLSLYIIYFYYLLSMSFTYS